MNASTRAVQKTSAITRRPIKQRARRIASSLGSARLRPEISRWAFALDDGPFGREDFARAAAAHADFGVLADNIERIERTVDTLALGARSDTPSPAHLALFRRRRGSHQAAFGRSTRNPP